MLGSRGKKVFDPPCIKLQYNCQSKAGRLSVAWCILSKCINLAVIHKFIKNFKSNDKYQFIWKWQEMNIIKMKKDLEHNAIQLAVFTKIQLR